MTKGREGDLARLNENVLLGKSGLPNPMTRIFLVTNPDKIDLEQ